MRIAANYTLLLRFAVFTALLAPVGCGDDDRVPRDAARSDGGDTERPDGALEMCEAGLVDCGEGCTRLAGDSANCGACGIACPSGFSCAVGRCDCEEPLLSCDGLCTDPATDNDNCGMCGNVCREGDLCLEGTCVVDCEAPNQRCPGTESEYICSDPQTDSLNCGVCGGACSSGAVCVGGSCSCGEEQISCSGACVDPMNDATHCGDCLTSCGAEGVCMDGACSTCGAGLTACGAVARCTDTDTSRLHCGACDNTCGPGEGCMGGECTCLAGFTDCDGECAALTSDRNNCGACGIDCGLGTCSAGTCNCADDATMCGAGCAVLETDRNNCNECGNACGTGELCRESSCLLLNAICETATPITGNITITGQDIALGERPPSGAGCGFGGGSRARYYAVTVPAGQRVTATATSTTDLVLFVQDACSDSGCTIFSDTPEQVTVNNVAGTADRTFYVGVRGYSSATGTFNIGFTYATPVVADNASCETATAVSADTIITGEDLAGGGGRPPGEGCGTGSGATALYYAVTVPAGQRVRAIATNNASLVMFVQDACGDAGCTGSSTSEELKVDNLTGADRTFYIGVRGATNVTGTFDIAFTYTTPVIAINDNTSCAMATVVTANTTIVGGDTTLGGASPTGDGCGGGTGATALYYAVTVPPNQRARVVADSSADLVVFSQAACSDTTCTRSSDTPEELTVDNVFGATPRTEYIGVRGYGSSTTGIIELSVTYTTPVLADNASCAAATVLSAGTPISGELITEGGPRPTGTGCGSGTGATALYYEVTVPAGDRARVVADSSSDLVVFSQDACSDTTCTDSSDTPEELTLDNSLGTVPRTEYIGVRGYGSATTGTFDLRYGTIVVPTNVSCETATVVTSDAMFSDQLTEFGGPRPGATDCGGGSGVETLYYAVTIPAGDRVVVATAPSGDIVLFELPTCGAAACVAFTDSSPETLTYTNSTAAPVTHVFGVRPWGSFSGTPAFGITFTYSTL